MPHQFLRPTRIAAIAAAALLAAGCGGGGEEAVNDAGAESLDANQMLDAPMNDASALESLPNATEPAPPLDTGNQGTDAVDPLGNTSGGDTGGNTVASNVSGM